MGNCVQGKSSLTSTPRNGVGIEKMKAERGYYVGGGSNGHDKESEKEVVETKEEVMEESGRKVEEELVDGWPSWLVSNVPRGVLHGLVPKTAESYAMIGKVGSGTYSNVYKARDKDTGKLVALKKVRFDTSESESVRFMAREISILQKLDHPNVLKLVGLATSRMQYSLYLVFEFMQTDLARIISRPNTTLTEPQVKFYMHQLLSGLQHCHERGILHRDIKGSNLLIDKNGMLKIGDFGLANEFDPDKKKPLTSRVVTLWYRAPELLLGSTDYGVGIDLWSAGCLLAEMLAGRPIMPGRTEVEQLHRIFKLCGSPSEDYWRKLGLSTNFRLPTPYKPSIFETFKEFPTSSLGLLTTLLQLYPYFRGTAASALQNEFFSTKPLACGLSDLPVIYQEEDDESVHQRERRKRRNSKVKHRSRSQKETSVKFVQDPNISKPNQSSSIEETKSGKQIASSQDSGSSTGSTTASSLNLEIYPENSPPLINSTLVSKPAPRTQYHPASSRNIMNPHLPPRPISKVSYADLNVKLDINLLNLRGLEKRSASMSDANRVAREQLPKHYAD